MNYIDVIIILLIIWGGYRGFSKGLVMMAAALAALVAGVWGAIRFSHLTAEILTDTLEVSTPYLQLVSFTITFLIIVITITLIAHIVSKLLDIIALGFLNRIAGMVFGAAKMVFILSVLFVVLNAFNSSHNFLPEEDLEKSRYYYKVADIAPQLFPSLHFREIAKEIEDAFYRR